MRTYRPYHPEQLYLLPPSLNDWLQEDHLALFISEVVDVLDLSELHASYASENGKGQPPYHPAMMVKILLYGYCVGRTSSRKIEKATWNDIAFRVLAANQHPDHDSIAEFRKRHLQPLARLFKQVLLLAQEAGLVKVGLVALDGTKVKANASKHKAMSYERMCETEKRLEAEIKELLAEAQTVDEAEDAQYGKGKRGDELPEELRRRESRLRKISEAKAALEARAQAKAQAEAEEMRKKSEEEKSNSKNPPASRSAVPDPADVKPKPKDQINFTDPDSRIMLDGATKGFEQAYNGQIVVDVNSQIIVATGITQETNDKKQLVPMLTAVQNSFDRLPDKALADAGYFSEANVTAPALEFVGLLIPPDRQQHGRQKPPPILGRPAKNLSVADRMRRKLRTKRGRKEYALRKSSVEPAIGQIKEAMGFRRFSFRGISKVRAEWDIVCLAHNLLKIFRQGWLPSFA